VPNRYLTERIRSVLDIVTTVAVLVASILVIRNSIVAKPSATTTAKLSMPSAPLSLAGHPTKGSPTAKAALLVFSDFQCPYCKAFARDTLPLLEKQYVSTGQLLVVYRYLPLATHPLAGKAARAAACAAEQGQFWDAHDALFSDRPLDELVINDLPMKLRLKSETYEACRQRVDRLDSVVNQDAAIGHSLGITGTPSFFIGEILPGNQVKITDSVRGNAQPDIFRAKLDAIIKRARS
jgi:protein-disulfide isomerase